MTGKAFRDNWEDVQKLHKENPETYIAPPLEEIRKLKKGSLVKICNETQRFWVEIINSKGGKDFERRFVGRVDNKIIDKSNYDYNDYVIFEAKHIYDFWIFPEFKIQRIN